MPLAVDLFAEINPAFGVFTLVAFCRSYLSATKCSPHISLLYLAVPIAMSNDTQETFKVTNARTGLLAWLSRHPTLLIDLDARLDAALPIVTASLRLGLTSRALELGRGGTVHLGSNVPPKTHSNQLPQRPRQVIRRAERLGLWMAGAGTPGAIFSAFGIAP